jgi:hypothetical protein
LAPPWFCINRQLAEKSYVSVPTIRDVEVNGSDPKQSTVHKCRPANITGLAD